MRMPVVFFGHGSPMNALASNRYTRAWGAIADATPPPKSILAVSAHWCTRGTLVTAGARQKTIHDFYGFPKALFDIEYPAPGDPELAARVSELLAPIGVEPDSSWGLDHGTWSVLLHAYPDAQIPVVQLSMDATQPASYHYALGARLAPLRDEGVLIAGFGNVVHNLQLMKRDEKAPPYDWAARFERLVRDSVVAGEHARLVGFEALGEDARLSVPTPEHYLPLLYVLGAQRGDESAAIVVEGIENGSLSMLSAVVGAR
jgi:4,5-DOPA dioxygenase extradiol